jgi:pantoate--beta-alanine ligase
VRLNRTLRGLKEAVEGGARNVDARLEAARRDLTSHGWRVDYVELRERERLAPPGPGDRELVVLGAAWLGNTRLIDNLEIDA